MGHGFYTDRMHLLEDEKRYIKRTQSVLSLFKPLFYYYINAIADNRFSSIKFELVLFDKGLIFV